MRSTPWIVALALAALTSATDADPTKETPLPSTGEERVMVQLVQLPFVATDRQGRPITDLTKDEIRVKIRGQEPTIDYLERLTPQATAAESLPDVRLYLDAPGGWSEPVSACVSNAYLAIVVDDENDTPVRRDEAIQKTVDFIDKSLDPCLRIAVFSYSGTLQLEMPFTNNREAAKSSIRLAASREGRPRVDPNGRIRKLVDALDLCISKRGDFTSDPDPRCVRDVSNNYVGEMRPRSADLITALDGVVRYLAGLHGRKNVFVLSHGFPIDLSQVLMEAARGVFGNSDSLPDLQMYVGFGDDPRLRMDKLIESLIRQHIAMTFIDRTAMPMSDFSAARGQPSAPGTSPLRAEYDGAVGDMEQIAVSSGGMHVRETDVTLGLKKAFDAQAGAYELGFKVAGYLDPEKLAKIGVSCTRRGVKIFSRRGVYAAPAQAEETLSGRIRFGQGSPIDAARGPGIHQPFVLEVAPESIGYELTDTEARTSFTLHMLVLRTADAKHLAETYHFVDHSYEKANWSAGDRAPMTLTGWVELPPGGYTLEAWIRNVKTGREGVIRQTVRVPEKFNFPEPKP